MHTADVKNVLRVYSIEVAAREKDDLNEDPIVARLRKVRSGNIQYAQCSRPEQFDDRLVELAMTAFKMFKYRTIPCQCRVVVCIRNSSHHRSWRSG